MQTCAVREAVRLQATIITQSFKHIIASGSQVIDHAYDLMRKMHPELAAVIAAYSFDELKIQLLNSLIYVVDHLDEEEVAIAYLHSLGKKLKNQNLRPEYFDEIKDVIIRSISTFLNEKWTPKAKEQWNLAFEFINYHLMKGANVPLTRNFVLPNLGVVSNHTEAKKVEQVPKSEPVMEIPLESKVQVEASLKGHDEHKGRDHELKGMGHVEVDFDDIFALLEPELEALVSLSPQQLEQIKEGATSHAKALVSRYWENAFKGALEQELSDIEDSEQSGKSKSEAA